MHLIEIAPPVISGNEARFTWTVIPESELYHRTTFRLRFPDSVALDVVPAELWWRVALLCLHAHWPLLRPCQVQLPVGLPPGEGELWLRLTDAAVATLEAAVASGETGRAVEIAPAGPPLSPPGHGGAEPRAGVISCFSGGRDGIAQAAMLNELGHSPTLVTVTSPVPWSNEHDTPRRREVLRETARRGPFELVEVISDLRGNVRNDFAAARYRVSVNEISDTFLYLAAALVVAASRRARLVLMASEAEVQENVKRGGMVIQMRHFMYSAATHRALAALFAPSGIGIGSLTYPMHQFHVQRLLSERYAEYRDLQYSCWELARHEPACSRCSECRTIALNLIATGVSPTAAGIDLFTLLLANEEWKPGSQFLTRGAGPGASPSARAGRTLEMHQLRCLASTPPERVAALLPGNADASRRDRALRIYATLRAAALEYELEPEPGYRAGYLELIDPELRDGVRSILDQLFAPAPLGSYARMLANTRLLSDWISAPLLARDVRRPPGARCDESLDHGRAPTSA